MFLISSLEFFQYQGYRHQLNAKTLIFAEEASLNSHATCSWPRRKWKRLSQRTPRVLARRVFLSRVSNKSNPYLGRLLTNPVSRASNGLLHFMVPVIKDGGIWPFDSWILCHLLKIYLSKAKAKAKWNVILQIWQPSLFKGRSGWAVRVSRSFGHIQRCSDLY